MTGPHARNALDRASSPYLRQHADNPVHWQQWGEDALREARTRDVPLLVSIGYAACHWCHVMAHESFENEAIAAQMNDGFVCIKIDREERPDIDQFCMNAVQAMGEQGGWPLTIAMTPEGSPFWGGTYFPPEPRYGRPGFPQVLDALSKAWRENRAQVVQNGAVLTRHLAHTPRETARAPDADGVTAFTQGALRLHDSVHGGLRGAPKFPNAPILETWARAARGDPASEAGTAFLRTLLHLCDGGIWDHLGGGLHRYAVDEIWLVPHFEKMLYDNALLLRHLVWAHQLHPNPLWETRAGELVGWLMREMVLPAGGFAASLDADTEGEEGRFYVWSAAEIADALGPDAALFARAYGVSADGNFEGSTVLSRLTRFEPSAEEEDRLAGMRARLLALRERRPRPARDDKCLADWNGLMIRALAEAGTQFARPDWIEAAVAAFEAVTGALDRDGALAHSLCAGVEIRPGLLSDHAAMMNAALSLVEATGEARHLAPALVWRDTAKASYGDGAGGFWLNAEGSDAPARQRADQDDPVPSAASQLAEALLRLGALAERADITAEGWALAGRLQTGAGDRLYGQAGAFNAADSALRHAHVLMVAGSEAEAGPFLEALRATCEPARSSRWLRTRAESKLATGGPEGPFALVCRDQTCSLPLRDGAALQAALTGAETATQGEG